MPQFAQQRKISDLDYKIEDWRYPKASASSRDVWTRMRLDEMDPAVKEKHDQKIEKLISSALAHNDAELRFDIPSKAIDRSLVFGPDHRVIKPASTTLAPGGCIGAGDYDDEDELFDDEEEEFEETRVASNDQVNEARKDAILGAITTATWQRAKERYNKHEKLFLNVTADEQTSNMKIKD